MNDRQKFPHLADASRRMGSRTQLSLEELRELLCHDCDFWHEEHEDDLECSSFRMLRVMLEDGALTPARLAAMVGADGGGGDGETGTAGRDKVGRDVAQDAEGAPR